MSTADAPLARLCSRQTCRRPARTTLTFVYSDSTAVIGPLSVHAEPHAYDLCVPHAQRMTPPRGWEIVRLEGIPASQDEDAPDAQPGSLVADSAPLAPLSSFPGADRGASNEPAAGSAGPQRSTAEGGGAADGSDDPISGPDSSAEVDAPGNASGSAPRGWGRRRRSRLHAVASDAAPSETGEGSGSAARGADAAGRSDAEQPAADTGPWAETPRDAEQDSRRSELRAVPAPAPADAAQRSEDERADASHDESRASEDAGRGGPDDGFDSLTDEIFAGEGTEYVPARWGAASQPAGMRRPHLRRGRR